VRRRAARRRHRRRPAGGGSGDGSGGGSSGGSGGRSGGSGEDGRGIGHQAETEPVGESDGDGGDRESGNSGDRGGAGRRAYVRGTGGVRDNCGGSGDGSGGGSGAAESGAGSGAGSDAYGESGGGSSAGSGSAATLKEQKPDAKRPTPDKWGGADFSDKEKGSGGAGSNAAKRPAPKVHEPTVTETLESAAGSKRQFPDGWGDMTEKQRKNCKGLLTFDFWSTVVS
jgi:hypothetical protein